MGPQKRRCGRRQRRKAGVRYFFSVPRDGLSEHVRRQRHAGLACDGLPPKEMRSIIWSARVSVSVTCSSDFWTSAMESCSKAVLRQACSIEFRYSNGRCDNDSSIEANSSSQQGRRYSSQTCKRQLCACNDPLRINSRATATAWSRAARRSANSSPSLSGIIWRPSLVLCAAGRQTPEDFSSSINRSLSAICSACKSSNRARSACASLVS